VAEVFDAVKGREKILEAEIAGLRHQAGKGSSADEEVAAALALLRRLAEWGAQAEDYGAIGELFRQVNVKLFARFQAMPVKKRVLNKLVGGAVTFGSSAPPIEIYQGPTARRKITGPAAPDAAGPVANDAHTIPKPLVPGQEGESLGNVRRGDWIRTSDLLNPIQCS
jgi:hypothetical protein